jgi:Fur family peroxide stress response transcriptional regulator
MARRLEESCRKRRIPVTQQRRAVFDAVTARGDHPTADDVYEDVRRRLPEISRTTVYRVLELLVDLGIVTKIAHPGATIRFDGRTERHHHLICLHCNELFDIEDPGPGPIEPPDTREIGFEITDYSIHFRGVCRACRQLRSGRREGGSKELARTRRGRARDDS